MASDRANLARYALLSIAVAIVTMALKFWAWQLTGSVGLLSDALESIVNIVAAVVAFIALRVVARPADSDHNFGHSKVEYFSAVIEGVMIAVAAILILYEAIRRLAHPEPLESLGLGLGIAAAAAALNGAAAVVLMLAGRKHRSLTLTADGKHLMTDVWTTGGVIVGVVLVGVTGWLPLDSLIAIAVALSILFVGHRLIVESGAGLMDIALPDDERAQLDAVLDSYRSDEVTFHDIRTRESGHVRFLQLHMLVPGDWTVQRAHGLADTIEDDLHDHLEELHITTHIEPIGDPAAYEKWRLE